MKKIIIDTRKAEEITVKLEIDGKTFEKTAKQDKLKAEIVLKLIKELLSSRNLKLLDLEEILVERGPGSYTGVKVGVSVANALSLALLTPVNSKKIGMIETPIYE